MVAVVHPEDLVSVILNLDIVWIWDSLQCNLFHRSHPVNTVSILFLSLFGIAHQVVPFVVPDGGMGRNDVILLWCVLVFWQKYLLNVVLHVLMPATLLWIITYIPVSVYLQPLRINCGARLPFTMLSESVCNECPHSQD